MADRFFSKDYFADSLREAAENYEDNEIHNKLEGTNYTLGVYRQSDGSRRYEVASWDDIDKPLLTSTSRSEVSSFVDDTVKQ